MSQDRDTDQFEVMPRREERLFSIVLINYYDPSERVTLASRISLRSARTMRDKFNHRFRDMELPEHLEAVVQEAPVAAQEAVPVQ